MFNFATTSVFPEGANITMNELSRHIEILLLDNDCVIVPNFGGFMAHHRPAEYVNTSGLFYPPQRTLGFNSQLRLNDSLLAQSYVEAYDISYPEAVKRIENDIAEIKQIIAIEGEYEFHGIGTVKKNTDEVYDFIPCTAGLLTPNLYALNSFSIDAITEEQATAEEEQPTAKQDCEKTIIGKKLTGSMVRNILAAAMILLLFVFSSMPAGLGSNKVMTCSVLDTEFITTFIKANTPFTGNTPSANTSGQQNPTEQQHIAIKTDSTPADTASTVVVANKQAAHTEPMGYVIVLASKVAKHGAEEFIAKLDKAGLKDARLQERGSMRKVVYGNYPTEESAYNALQTLRKTSAFFTEAWISK